MQAILYICNNFVYSIPFQLLQHLSYGNGSLRVDAAFQQTLWSVAPISSGSEIAQGTFDYVILVIVLSSSYFSNNDLFSTLSI